MTVLIALGHNAIVGQKTMEMYRVLKLTVENNQVVKLVN
jgi:hypothetical protein